MPRTINELIKGFVYILRNPSFSQYIKIGYAKDVQKQLNTLNSSSAVLFTF
ncbi:MAG: GIY-YIG nuclease family protein [Kiritimatiellae bacterium]|nr:GIY-YIG nuclease family protein [Kiritimatiellia bacterium]